MSKFKPNQNSRAPKAKPEACEVNGNTRQSGDLRKDKDIKHNDFGKSQPNSNKR